VLEWSRVRNTYGGGKTTNEEAIWFSPACIGVADLAPAPRVDRQPISGQMVLAL
jgi:hypothetical protein